jgi:hypothetical protein
MIIPGLSAWYAKFDSTVRSKLQRVLTLYGKKNQKSGTFRYTKSELDALAKNKRISKESLKELGKNGYTIAPFDSVTAKKELDAVLATAGSLRAELVGILAFPKLNPAQAQQILSVYDKIMDPIFKFANNTSGTVPADPNQALFEWFMKYLRPLMI